MNDKKDDALVELFWKRDEKALEETEKRYHGFANSVLSSFINIKEDREECINDAWLVLWQSIPPERPRSFSAYLAKILKNIALVRCRSENTWKRGGRAIQVEDEFLRDVSDGRTVAEDYESTVTERVINEFLSTLSKEDRRIFVLRYWFDEDITRISQRTGRSVGSITMLLKRLREKLAKRLIKEGILYE